MSVLESRAQAKGIAGWYMAAIGVCLLLQAWLAATMEINWDEFFYLSHLYDYRRGEMAKALQSLHVHLLGWITYLPGNEVDQVLVGRFVMLVCLCGTSALIYRLCRTYFSRAAAMVAVLAFLSAGPTIVHGASFRADPISAFFIMLSLVTLARARPSLQSALFIGACAAVSAMITIKVGLYAPAFLGIVVWRLRERDERPAVLKWLVGTAMTAGFIFAALYLLQLSLIEKSSNAASQALLGNAAKTALLSPKWDFVAGAAKIATVQVVFFAVGAVSVVTALFRTRAEQRYRAFAISCCGATLLCVVIYRNAFPYFFPFIMPPAMLLVAWVVDRFAVLQRPLWIGVAVAAFVLPALMVGASWLFLRDKPPQRQVVEAVHHIFPQPVAMIDQFHVIGSFPKRGFFMSTWGVAKYREGKPVFAEILKRDVIPLLLVDGPAIDEAIRVGGGGDPEWLSELPLFPEDRTVLAQNYVSYWGPIRVAGKRLPPGTTSGKFELLIPGAYRVKGSGATIDGRYIPDNAAVTLTRGQHTYESAAKGDIVLLWAQAAPPPREQAPVKHLFSPFFGWAAE